MSDFFTISGFNFGGVLASVISSVLLYLMARSYQRVKKVKQEAADRLKDKIAKLEAVGNTTELGFFVLMELGSLRQTLEMRKYISMIIFAYPAFLLAALFLRVTFLDEYKAEVIVLLNVLAAMCLFGLSVFLVWREEKYIRSYQEKVQNIWREPIEKQAQEKQAKSKDNSTSPSVETAS